MFKLKEELDVKLLLLIVAYSVRYDWVVRDIYSKENFTRMMFEGGSYRSVASYPYGIICIRRVLLVVEESYIITILCSY